MVRNTIDATQQKKLIDSAIGRAKKNELPAFDPQGRILIQLNYRPETSRSDEQNATKEQSPVKKIVCSIDIGGVKELKESFLGSLGEEYRPKLEALFNSGSRGSVIPLQEEVMMHGFLILNIVKKAFKKSKKKLPQKEIKNIKEELSTHVNEEVKEAFKKALDKACKKNEDGNFSVNIKKLNKVLDKARKQISLSAEAFLVDQFRSKKLKAINGFTSVTQHISKHLAESTTAIDCDFLHTDASAGLITFVEHSPNTSHNRLEGGKNLAVRQVQHHEYHYNDGETTIKPLAFPRVSVRVPSIALKGRKHNKIAVKDVAEKILFIKSRYSEEVSGTTSKALVYNLLTALNGNSLTDQYDERKNKQRESADRILRGAHLANRNELHKNTENPLYCFVQNISVNGFGQSLGYQWYKRSTTKEATLMAEIALLHTLKENNKSISDAYETVIGHYKNFINQIKDKPDYFYKSKEGKAAAEIIKTLKGDLLQEKDDGSSEEAVKVVKIQVLAKKALQHLFVENRHFEHRYAKLIQTLSVLCEKFSVSGCKSANERAQAIFGRVSVLLSLEGKEYSKLSDMGKKLVSAFESEPFDAGKLNKALDIYYNECGLQGGPSKISLLDQGGPSKLQSVRQAGLMPNTNYGESGSLSYLYQSKASKMQAHKGVAERIKKFISPEIPLSKFRKTVSGLLSLIGFGFLVPKTMASSSAAMLSSIWSGGVLSESRARKTTEEVSPQTSAISLQEVPSVSGKNTSGKNTSAQSVSEENTSGKNTSVQSVSEEDTSGEDTSANATQTPSSLRR